MKKVLDSQKKYKKAFAPWREMRKGLAPWPQEDVAKGKLLQ